MAEIARDTLIDGRYRVVRRLGTGGMAEVFLAEDQQLGRKVALKLLTAGSPRTRGSSSGSAARRSRRPACSTRTSSRSMTGESSRTPTTSRWSTSRAARSSS